MKADTVLEYKSKLEIKDICEFSTMRLPHSALFLALQVFKVLAVEEDAKDGVKSSAAARPNILIMLADDLGWHDLSWHNPRVTIIDIISMLLSNKQTNKQTNK